MVPNNAAIDPYSPSERCFECVDCGKRVRSEERLTECEGCGGAFKNIAIPRE